jgi:geranylgeranyl diphosphate synthase type 3
MDDVEDDSLLRRGMPGEAVSVRNHIFEAYAHIAYALSVAHKIYGVPQTINAANYIYFLAYQELFQFRRRETEGPSSPGAKGKEREKRKGLDEVITGESS